MSEDLNAVGETNYISLHSSHQLMMYDGHSDLDVATRA